MMSYALQALRQSNQKKTILSPSNMEKNDMITPPKKPQREINASSEVHHDIQEVIKEVSVFDKKIIQRNIFEHESSKSQESQKGQFDVHIATKHHQKSEQKKDIERSSKVNHELMKNYSQSKRQEPVLSPSNMEKKQTIEQRSPPSLQPTMALITFIGIMFAGTAMFNDADKMSGWILVPKCLLYFLLGLFGGYHVGQDIKNKDKYK